MSRSVAYVRKGSNLDGSFQALTPDQKTLLTKDRDAFLSAGGATSVTPGLGSKIYADILSFISHPSGATLPGLPTVELNAQVSPAVFNWLAGAQDVNVGTSFAAVLIQDYTIDQFTY